jgi:hypothetical protein
MIAAIPMAAASNRRLYRRAAPVAVLLVVLVVLLTVGCGGAGRATVAADLAPLPQPTPDPTVDAVIRGLPRPALVAQPTSTPAKTRR